MIMKLLYYDHVLYTRWYGQEVYKLYIFKKKKSLSFWFQEDDEKKKPRFIQNHHVHIFFSKSLLLKCISTEVY